MKSAIAAVAMAGAAQAHLADQLSVNVALASNNLGGPWPIPPESSAIGADWGFFNNVTVTVQNKGPAVAGKDWKLYFSTPRRVLAVNTDQFTVRQRTGDLYELTPTARFTGIPASGKVTIPLTWEYWVLYRTDFMPRWYVVDGAKAKVVANTDSEDDSTYAVPVTAEQFKRSGGDANVLQTPAVRYEANKAIKDEDVSAKLIPTPLEITQTGSPVAINGFKVSGLPEPHASAVKDRLQALKLVGSFDVQVSVNPSKVSAKAQKAGGYELTVTATSATVVGYDNGGAFYGVQSLIALVNPGKAPTVPQVKVVDAPRFAYRGQHTDVARNFHDKKTIMRLLDQMAAYKLNTFLLHASDDEGWRVEIDGLPELTSVGATRCHDEEEATCLLPQLGSGPDGKALYYSKADYVDIVRYAAARNIRVIPEFDMPGHARAAVRAMEARYKRTGSDEYRLLDPADATRLATVQYYGKDSLINPCVPGTRNFVRKVIKEVKALHDLAGQPLTTWSWGGDEAKNAIDVANDWPKTDNYPIWNIDSVAGQAPVKRSDLSAPYAKSPACNGAKPDDLIKQFAITVSEEAQAAGVAGFQSWQDGVKRFDSSELKLPAVAMDWDALFWGTEIGNHAAKGYKVVSSNPDFTYFDMPYETSPAERGYYWASRGTNLRKILSFAPVNVWQNAETSKSRDNTPYELETDANAAQVQAAVIGMQGHVWTETVRTAQHFDYMAFPRVLALAERAWHVGAHELAPVAGRKFSATTTYVSKEALDGEFNTFVNVLGKKELPKLQAAGVAFRVPPAGASIIPSATANTLAANSEIPGVQVEYSANASGPFKAVPAGGVSVRSNQVFVRSNINGQVSRSELVGTCVSSQVNRISNQWCQANGCPAPACTYSLSGATAKQCKSIKAPATDAWCASTGCPEVYKALCAWQ